MKKHDERRLYIVATRNERVEPCRDLTPLERAAGWDWFGTGDQRRAFLRGHDTGRLHSLTSPHVLTWNPEPGDSILASLTVDFVFTVIAPDDPEEEFVAWECASAAYNPAMNIGRVVVRAATTLGRPVSLGEDGAEDAFGRDAIYEQVAHAILNDWRNSPCAYSAEMADAETRYRKRITREEARQVCADLV